MTAHIRVSVRDRQLYGPAAELIAAAREGAAWADPEPYVPPAGPGLMLSVWGGAVAFGILAWTAIIVAVL